MLGRFRGLSIVHARQFSSSSESVLSTFGNVLGGEQMSPEAMGTFRAWHSAVSHGSKGGTMADFEEIGNKFKEHVHPQCKFSPPTYYKSWEGRDEFLHIISCVGEVFGKSFTYGRQFVSPDGRDWGLEFTAEIGDSKLKMEGIDLVRLDEEGKIIEFSVLARPPSAVTELKNQMMRKATPGLLKLKAKKVASSFFG